MSIRNQEATYQLERQLERTAATWHGASQDRRPALEQQYAAILDQLYALGWDDYIDMQALLPDEHMPEMYFQRHPEARNGIWMPSPGAIPLGPGYTMPNDPALFPIVDKQEQR